MWIEVSAGTAGAGEADCSNPFTSSSPSRHCSDSAEREHLISFTPSLPSPYFLDVGLAMATPPVAAQPHA